MEGMPEPVAGYDLLSVAQVIESFAGLPSETQVLILRYEAATRRRSAILRLGDG